ncbi:uncharacterized protein [Diadema antillarum]|uniref:uncharacterized protein n=1 Tax=Diadema antillarum TaxID=105358 RepID=UPI003A8515A3
MMASSGRTGPNSRVVEKDVTGVVRRFIKARGFGFITLHNDASDDVFFPITAVADDDRPLLKQSGEKSLPVKFDLLIEQRGFAAERVRFIGKSANLDDDNARDTQSIESLSALLRKQGNLLSQSLNDKQPAVERSAALREAIKWYQSSLGAAKSSQDGASAAKNAATASWKLASLYRENLKLSTSDAKIVVKRYDEAMGYFTRALKDGHCKGAAWTKQLEELMQKCLKEKLELMSANESQMSKHYAIYLSRTVILNRRETARTSFQ